MAFTQLPTTCQSGSLSGTNIVTAGVSSVVVTISAKSTNYKVNISPNWNTTFWITGITTTSFTVNFNTPAPDDGSGKIYWNLTDF